MSVEPVNETPNKQSVSNIKSNETKEAFLETPISSDTKSANSKSEEINETFVNERDKLEK